MKYLAILLSAVLVMAQSPTPVQPTSKPPYDPNAPVVRYQPRAAAAGWQRFKGAKSCEQVGSTLTCDNGYRQTVR